MKRGGSEIMREPGERGRVVRRPLPFPGVSSKMYEGGGEAMVFKRTKGKKPEHAQDVRKVARETQRRETLTSY